MKPVSPKNAIAQVSDDKPLMLLNRRLLEVVRIRRLLAFGSANIKTKGGLVLSIELWDLILEFLAGAKKPFCFAQGISLRNTSKGQILHFRKVYLEEGPLCGYLENTEEVEAFEGFMDRPNHHAALLFDEPIIHPGKTYDIVIPSADIDLPADPPFLFSDLTVPDVIAHIEGGNCWFCKAVRQSRFFCPGCTGGVVDNFGMRMGCGVNLACPLCLGIDFSREHKAFLEKYYREPAPEDEEKDVNDWIQDRMDELGYTTSKIHS